MTDTPPYKFSNASNKGTISVEADKRILLLSRISINPIELRNVAKLNIEFPGSHYKSGQYNLSKLTYRKEVPYLLFSAGECVILPKSHGSNRISFFISEISSGTLFDAELFCEYYPLWKIGKLTALNTIDHVRFQQTVIVLLNEGDSYGISFYYDKPSEEELSRAEVVVEVEYPLIAKFIRETIKKHPNLSYSSTTNWRNPHILKWGVITRKNVY